MMLLKEMQARGTILDATVTAYPDIAAHRGTSRAPRPKCCEQDGADLTAMAYRAGVLTSVGTDTGNTLTIRGPRSLMRCASSCTKSE